MKYLDRFFEPKGWEENSFTNADGRNIRFGHAKPEGESRGTVVITTGYADFIEPYFETIHEYLERGYEVWMMDWAGHGGSDKQKSAAEKTHLIEDHVRDLHQFRHDIVKTAEKKPVFMSTHSMGAQIGLQYMAAHKDDFDFAVLAAPLIDFRVKGFARALLKTAFSSAVGLGMGNKQIKGGRKGITRSMVDQRRKLRKDDPVRMDLHRTFMMLNRKLRAEDPTIGMIDSLFESTVRMNEEGILKSIHTPVLIGEAGDDDIVDGDSIRRAARLLPAAKHVCIAGAVHGLWQERQKQRLEWWGHVDSFLQEQQSRFERRPRGPGSDDPPPSAVPPASVLPPRPEGPRV